jgi:hypothetical protein
MVAGCLRSFLAIALIRAVLPRELFAFFALIDFFNVIKRSVGAGTLWRMGGQNSVTITIKSMA